MANGTAARRSRGEQLVVGWNGTRQLTDDRFVRDRGAGLDARAGQGTPMLTLAAFVQHYPRPPAPAWQAAVGPRLAKLRTLAAGWDGYQSPALNQDTLWFAVELLDKIMRPGTSPPQIVPSSVGGVQIEWHEKDIDLEIHIAAPYKCELWYEDRRSGQVIDEQFTADFSILSAPVAALSNR
jgi:hypothetical protein